MRGGEGDREHQGDLRESLLQHQWRPTLVGGQKYAFFGLPSLTLAGQNVLLPANIREGAAVGCQT